MSERRTAEPRNKAKRGGSMRSVTKPRTAAGWKEQITNRIQAESVWMMLDSKELEHRKRFGRPPRNPAREQRLAAWHEAGHALAANLLGCPLVRARIYYDLETKRYEGSSDDGDWSMTAPRNDVIRMLLAGIGAEQIAARDLGVRRPRTLWSAGDADAAWFESRGYWPPAQSERRELVEGMIAVKRWLREHRPRLAAAAETLVSRGEVVLKRRAARGEATAA